MCRTKFKVKCRRHFMKVFSRKAHHGIRNDNRFADELSFMMYKQSSQRNCYASSYQDRKDIIEKGLEEYGEKLKRDGEGARDSMRKRLQEEVRRMFRKDSENSHMFGMRCKTIKVSDVFIAAHKRLKRRGTLQPFQGHRQRGIQYKRDIYFECD